MRRPDVAWAAWLTAVLASFAALEVPALIRGRRDPGKGNGTLTFWLRGVLGTRDKRRRRWLLGPAFGVFCAWLAGHILGGWWNW
ncbi:hypothetical protein [Amycolatopsis kentuckyensis]|uniref:hypothetical protein n=1 Tax=Amycolatopsis kentuckyensis TaxID=218823 RepID=UPI001177B7BC|nr:hypothetical protein [Amycolatopsis kentuckyensis]